MYMSFISHYRQLLSSYEYSFIENNNFQGNVPPEFGNLEVTESLWLSE